MRHTYSIKTKLWKWQSEKAAWHFVSIDTHTSEEIKIRREPSLGGGFGAIKVEVTIGDTTWETSIFPSKTKGFILPIKASVRKNENLKEGNTINISFAIL